MENAHKPFIPRDEPKSWIVFDLAVLTGFLVAGPAMASAYFLGPVWLEMLGKSLFLISWLTAAVMFCTYVARKFAGRYAELQERDWREQVW